MWIDKYKEIKFIEYARRDKTFTRYRFVHYTINYDKHTFYIVFALPLIVYSNSYTKFCMAINITEIRRNGKVK